MKIFLWGVFIFVYQYSVIGGDVRQVLLLKDFQNMASCIRYGVGEEGDKAASIELAVSLGETLLLPIPMCKGNKLNIQQQGSEVTKEEILRYLRAGQTIFAGCIDKEWKRRAEEKGAVCYDYMEEKTIAIYNSIATAEGTIAEVIKAYPQNLHDTRVLVLGFGICGKTLAAKLSALSARVCIAARSKQVLMEAYANGYQTVALDKLADILNEYPVIINTIPARVISRTELACVQEEAMIFEIASYPYGVDVEAATELGVSVCICSAIPATYAPVSSVKILKQFILEKQGGHT